MENQTPTQTIVFEIKGLPKTTNSGGREHWRAKHNESKKWKKLVWLAVIQRAPLKPFTKAKLKLTRFSSGRGPDFDGLVSSFKHVVDGLIDSGILEDDRMVNIGQPEYVWEKCKPKEGKIRVEIEGII